MSSETEEFETGHTGDILDSQLDYYGKRLATASADHTIQVWDLWKSPASLSGRLIGHDGPVWSVSWAHPKFGSLLVSCSYDRKLIVWSEVAPSQWIIVYTYTEHLASINQVAFSPHEYGLNVATASSDGIVAVLTHQQNDQTWSARNFIAHPNGVNSVSWSPPPQPTSLNSAETNSNSPKLVTGGGDCQVRVWGLDENNSGQWSMCDVLREGGSHSNWVRDVAWRPNLGFMGSTIASCGDDGVIIFWNKESEMAPWKHVQSIKLPHPVWKLSWSITGTVLAAASGEGNILLLKETAAGIWEKVTDLREEEQDNNNNTLPAHNNSIITDQSQKTLLQSQITA